MRGRPEGRPLQLLHVDLSTRPAEIHHVPAESVPRTVYGVALALAITVCWILPLRNPLSRDETGTYWIVKDGDVDVVSRSFYWTNWSPYY